jgi:hypothetical protein
LIGGLIAFVILRKRRSKRNQNGFSHDDYTIDMNQNDFAHGNSAAAAAAAAAATTGSVTATNHSNELLSPFDHNRRYAPGVAAVGAGAAGMYGNEAYGDYQEGYSQEGYSQDGYNNYGQQPDYGYYDNNNYAAAAAPVGGYDHDVYANNAAYDSPYQQQQQQQKHHIDVASPTSAGNMSEAEFTSSQSVDKPNAKDYHSKPNEM